MESIIFFRENLLQLPSHFTRSSRLNAAAPLNIVQTIKKW